MTVAYRCVKCGKPVTFAISAPEGWILSVRRKRAEQDEPIDALCPEHTDVVGDRGVWTLKAR